ncbi:TIR domain-containing protein [bacterium]|nr:TIR domain-containing protein [bacterium]
MPPEIFASYSREDQAQVFPIVDELRERGLNIWIDQEGIHGAKLWSQEIVNAIESSKVFILFASTKAFLSKNVTKELALASESDKHILPIFIEDAEIPAAMKYQLAGIQHLVHKQGQTGQTADNILRTLGNLDIQSTDPLPKTVTAAPATKSAYKKPLIATALVIALLALIYIFEPSTPISEKLIATEPEAKPLDKNRIVVLPFKNIGTDGENDHIVEGIVDDLNTMLSKVDGLKVIGSVSAKTYRGSDMSPSEIGQELNTGTLIQGSIQKAGEQLKINVKLIDAKSGEIRWAESYNGNETDRFALQSQIVKSVGKNLDGIVIDEAKINEFQKSGTTNPEAYDLLQRAKAELTKFTQESIRQSIPLFEQVVQIDPNYADAYVELGIAYSHEFGVSLDIPKASMPKAIKALEKALKINQNHPVALSELGQIALDYEWNAKKANDLIKKAEQISPNNSVVIVGRMRLLNHYEKFEEAAQVAREGLEYDPNSMLLLQMLMGSYDARGLIEQADEIATEILSIIPNAQYPTHLRSKALSKKKKFEEAERLLQKAIEADNRNPVSVMSLGVVYWRQDKKEEAYSCLAEILNKGHFAFIKSDIFIRFYAAMGDYDNAYVWMNRAIENREPSVTWMWGDWTRKLFKEQRFRKLYDEAGIADFVPNTKAP